MIIADNQIPLSGASMTLARNLVARLNSFYPAFAGAWHVAVNEQGGVVEVTNLMLSGRWGFYMHTAKIDPEGRKVVRAAGELLERYRISRARSANISLDVLHTTKRSPRGDLVPDHG